VYTPAGKPENTFDACGAPPFREYVKVPVPPVAMAVMLPSDEAAHKGFTFVAETITGSGFASEIWVVAVHPFASFTVTMSVPDGAFKNVPEDWYGPPLNENLYGSVPPVATTTTDPVAAFAHAGACPVPLICSCCGLTRVTLVVAVHPFASVTVSVNEPAASKLNLVDV